MKHLFVPYEIALKLKQKGLDKTCFSYYLTGNNHEPILSFGVVNNRETGHNTRDCAAPLYQQVVDWFWDNHEIDITCGPTSEHTWWPMCTQFFEDEFGDIGTDIWPEEPVYYPTRYEALTEAILHAITLLP